MCEYVKQNTCRHSTIYTNYEESVKVLSKLQIQKQDPIIDPTIFQLDTEFIKHLSLI